MRSPYGVPATLPCSPAPTSSSSPRSSESCSPTTTSTSCRPSSAWEKPSDNPPRRPLTEPKRECKVHDDERSEHNRQPRGTRERQRDDSGPEHRHLQEQPNGIHGRTRRLRRDERTPHRRPATNSWNPQ